MDKKFCQACGTQVMVTLRMCPKCGGSLFDNSNLGTAQSINTTNTSNNNSTTVNSLIPAALPNRLIAYIVDTFVVSVISILPIAIANFLKLPYKSDTFSFFEVVALIGCVCIPYIYYTVLHSSEKQSTFGKRWLGLKIVTVSGDTLTKTQAFLRVLLTLIIPIVGVLAVSVSFSGFFLSFKESMSESIIIALTITILLIIFGPYLTIFTNKNKQSLFDLIVKTIVIKG